MEHYVGLDVSLKVTHICVVDKDGAVVARAREVTHPELLAAAIKKLAPAVVCVVLETGGQSSWLEQGLLRHGIPAVIVDARQAKAVLSCRVNKTDANDAEGLARLARSGWYKKIASKHPDSRRVRALVLARRQADKQRRDVENVVRALLRGFGLGVGTVSRGRFEERVRELLVAEPGLQEAIDPLLKVRAAALVQLGELDKRSRQAAAASEDCRRLMTVPGVGAGTALAFVTALDDPSRFARSSSVGAYLGLTSRRRQSGEMNISGRISKWGDEIARHFLYEAANALLTRTRRWSPIKAWGLRLAKKIGGKKARVAVARKLAVILHRIWLDGTTFRWSDEKEVVAA